MIGLNLSNCYSYLQYLRDDLKQDMLLGTTSKLMTLSTTWSCLNSSYVVVKNVSLFIKILLFAITSDISHTSIKCIEIIGLASLGHP